MGNNIDYGGFCTYLYQNKLNFLSEEMDIIEFLYNQRVYMYGKQFKVNSEDFISKYAENAKNILREIYCYKTFFQRKRTIENATIKILSSAYFGVNNLLNELSYETVEGPWRVHGSRNFLSDPLYVHKYYSFIRELNGLSFQNLISEKGRDIILDMLEETRKMLIKHRFAAVIANSTHTLSNRLPLRAATLEKIPTFVFLHGLPTADYDDEADKTDYLIVWSEKIKENYIKYSKFAESRIFVSGHPNFKKQENNKLKFTFDNILVIAPSTSDSWNIDRGNMILYLMLLEDVLKGLGVKKVRFRPHPHENPHWYLKFVDKSFFIVDSRPVNCALDDSTCVIGTPSTVLLEALNKGVNYVVFNPKSDNGRDIYDRFSLIPFDGSDDFLPIADSTQELKRILTNKIAVDTRFLDEYIQTPFDISFIKKLI